ncbi:pentapeptide repeat-containing protein [Halorussus limi]|uniref:Pentapeptide repeat-containing protein n=1 Tax=Halorussus limi TaxID=2938695 RepID=A0A8U0HPK8_9EURY|nr:pentapeptide repeat-containing protein [Halorussus limi]UPV72789.1 pentapeptide repeat-containing protein [Halorussus limi]
MSGEMRSTTDESGDDAEGPPANISDEQAEGVTTERPTTAEGRCGYTHEASAVTNLGGVCCWRPVWGETDRCIWHADVAQKPSRELENAAPTVGDRLDGAIFRDVELSGSDWLADRTITDARFVNCNLEDTDVSGSDLRYSHFEGVDAQSVNLRGANLEHTEFHRTDLRGADLCGARLHYAVFDNARVDESTNFGDNVVYEDELLDAEDDGITSLRIRRQHDGDGSRMTRYEAAHWTYKELQRLTEENGLTAASRNYYIQQKDVRRREAWEYGSYPRALGKETWRWTTGYGSNPWRVIATAAVVIVVCAILFPLVGQIHDGTPSGVPVKYYFDPGSGLYYNVVVFFQSLYFSVVTFATLGYGDMQPVFIWARAVAAAEALFGQLLMALLVFVLTRNVTWSE